MDDVSSQPATRPALILLSRACAILLLAVAMHGAWTFPVAAPWLLGGLMLYLLILWRRPAAWLLALPATLPVLDLGFWSGRFFFTEFDLVVLTTLAAGLWRAERWREGIDRGTAALALALLLGQSLVTLNGLLPLSTPAPGAWIDYLASTNAVREFKGLLWALLLWPMLGAARVRGDDLQRWLTVGMLAGLVSAFLSIVWERALFTGLFDLASGYRVSGWFSVMLTGGAAIDAFLALAAPFVAALFLMWRSPWARAVGVALGFSALYALYVTYSRANYPALAVMGLVLVAGLWRASHATGARLTRSSVAALVAGGLALVLLLALSGRNIQARFETTMQDLATRLTHWQYTLKLMDSTSGGLWLGAGKGTFAREYYWDHQLSGKHLAVALLQQEEGTGFIRFSRSDADGNLFLQQRFKPRGTGPYRLEATLRTPHGKGEALLVELCERHILKFRSECRWRKLTVPPGQDGWRTVSTNIDLRGLGQPRFGPFARPLDVSLMNRGIAHGLDIGSVRIVATDGAELLANPEFEAGWDHWFLSYGDHLRWHIKNVYLYWLYEGGIAGLLLMLGLGLYVALRLYGATKRGDRFAVLVAAALAGCLMVGLFDSLFDEPRITQAFFLLVGAGLIGRPSPRTLAAAGHGALLDRRRMRQIALAAGIGLIAVLLALALAPRARLSLQLGLLGWLEGNAPALAPLLRPDYAESARLLAAALPPWEPEPGDGLAPGEIRIGARRFDSLRAAARALRKGDTLDIGPGVYRQPLVINAHGVRVRGHGHVVIERTSAQGKAAIVTQGNDVHIRNIECRWIAVADRNGACVRHQTRNLTLDHVYFHDAEQGLLTAPEPGRVHILRSRFERLGKLGLAHGVYVGGGELLIEDSQILASRDWGHEIKSRARVTRIVRSVVASLGGNDSRLLDLPHGGVLEVHNSVLEQGPVSSNEGVIGFGLEGRPHAEQRITLSGNIIILERERGNRLFQLAGELAQPQLSRNVIVSPDDPGAGGDNLWFAERGAVGLPDYPALPPIPGD